MNSKMCDLWVKRSRSAVVIRSSAKIEFQSAKRKFVVTMIDTRSLRSEYNWKRSWPSPPLAGGVSQQKENGGILHAYACFEDIRARGKAARSKAVAASNREKPRRRK